MGFTRPRSFLREGCALTAPFHPHCAPIAGGAAVSFLWHFPSASHIRPSFPRRCLLAALPLAGILPCGARTFLTRKGATTLLPWG